MPVNFSQYYSTRANKMQASIIRRLLRLTQQPDIISFAGGLPDNDSLPLTDLRAIVDLVIQESGHRALQYGETHGYIKLREDVVAFMKSRGVSCTLEEVMITTGSQQALDLLCRVLISPGEEVLIENPGYIGMFAAVSNYEGVMVGVELDEQGIKPAALKEKAQKLIAAGRKPKFIYYIPHFQNPTGVTVPLKRRQEILKIAQELDLIIIEDDPYGELRFDRVAPVPAMKTFDTEGRVIFVGSFSKIFAPGVRLGWIVAHPEIIDKLILGKQSADACSDTLSQYIVHEYCRQNLLEDHIELLRQVYMDKRDVMLSCMEKEFPPQIKWNKPGGGFFIWVTLPPSWDAEELFHEAVKEKVAYVIGSAFHVDGGGKNTIRLNFSLPSDAQIREGIKRLGKVFKKRLKV